MVTKAREPLVKIHSKSIVIDFHKLCAVTFRDLKNCHNCVINEVKRKKKKAKFYFILSNLRYLIIETHTVLIV